MIVQQTIAIVGASTRAAAASASRSGFRPIAADLFADVDLRAIATTTRISPYPEGLLDWIRTVEPTSWMYTGALENYPDLIDQMAWVAPLWGNSGDVLARVRSPWELAAALQSASLLMPETRASADGLPRDGTWLAKTYRGASGSGVRVYDSECFDDDLAESTVFQRRLSGIPAAAVFAAANGTCRLIGVTQQLIGSPWLHSHGFQYSGSIGPLPIDSTTRVTIERIGLVLAEKFELVGLFGVDFLINSEGVWTIEVNPRYTASVEVIERATGVRAIELHASACSGDYSQVSQANTSISTTGPHALGAENYKADTPSLFHGKAILYAKHDIALTENVVDIALNQSISSDWPDLADISPAHEPIEAGRPILTLFGHGQTMEEVEQDLRLRVEKIERLIYGTTS